MGEQGAGSRGLEVRRARPRRRKRGEGAEAAPEAGEAQEAAGRDRVLSALGNQGVQRLLRGGGERSPVVQRQGPGPEGGEDSEEAAAAELDEALPDSDSDSEEQAEPEADIYELSPEVATSGRVVEAMVGGAAGDLEAGGPGAEQNASEKEQEALDEIDGVKPEVEGFGNALLILAPARAAPVPAARHHDPPAVRG